MKKAFLFLSLCLGTLAASAQKTFNSPSFGARNVKELNIEKVTLSDTATLVHFKATYPGNTWYRISDKSYITAGTNARLMARSISGIDFNKEIYNKTGPSEFTINFPAVKVGTTSIDYIEGDCDNCFRILDIDLSGKQAQNQLPAAFYANWFNNKKWILGLTRNKIIYQSAVWDYKLTAKTASRYQLTLKKGKSVKALALQQNANGELVVTDNGKTKLTLTDKPGDQKEVIANDVPFTTPILKSDSAVLIGYLKNYSPKLGYKTGSVIVDDVISGKQKNYVFTIAPDGTFTAKVPMHYPEEVYFEVGSLFKSVFLAPGKKLFQYVDMGKGDKSSLFMGDYASLNSELIETHDLPDINYRKMVEKAAVSSLAEYKVHITDLLNKNQAAIDKYRNEHGLSAKGYQLASMNMKYRMAEYLLGYNMNRESEHQKKHKDEKESTYKNVPYDADYLSFLLNVPVNDEISLLSKEYDSFVNRLMYLRQIFQHYNQGFTRFYIGAFKDVPAQGEEEKALLSSFTASLTNDTISLNNIISINKAAFDKMVERRKKYFDTRPKMDLVDSRREVLNELVKTKLNFTYDIMEVQDNAHRVTAEFTPYDAKALAKLKSNVQSPGVFKAFETFNNGVATEIALIAKNVKGYKRNNIPKTTADSVFAAILSKYKGKAVYVDFWATWCGPCRNGIEHVAPLKEELKGENVAFIYITNPSSPEDTYKKMIPGIAGEHYKLNKDEWNYIAGKYSISGIPRYMMVNKNGVIVNQEYNGWSGDVKTDLMKLAKE